MGKYPQIKRKEIYEFLYIYISTYSGIKKWRFHHYEASGEGTLPVDDSQATLFSRQIDGYQGECAQVALVQYHRMLDLNMGIITSFPF
jgi:hypothetical protein